VISAQSWPARTPGFTPYFDVWAAQVVRFGSPHPAYHPTLCPYAVLNRRDSNQLGLGSSDQREILRPI